jgi:hypothetical protein
MEYDYRTSYDWWDLTDNPIIIIKDKKNAE